MPQVSNNICVDTPLLPTMVEVQHTHDAAGTQKHTVPRLWLLPALAAIDAGPLAEVRAELAQCPAPHAQHPICFARSTAARCTAV